MNGWPKKRKILFLFAHLHKGGMQKAVSNISLALPEQFEQFVGYFGTENPGFEYNARMHNFQLPASDARGLLGKAAVAWRRMVALRAYIKEQEIDIVISFGESANVYSLMSGHGARKVITSRVALLESLSDNGLYGRVYCSLAKWLYPKADALVAVSEALADTMRNIVGAKVKVIAIPNLYHVAAIQELAEQPLPQNLAFLDNTRFLLNVGSLCHQKAQDDLLEVFARIYVQYRDVYLVLLGRGEWREQLGKQAESLQIRDRVIFIDFDLNPYRYMSRASAFVLTSRYEGFPNVLVEAMICKAPVVAFDCPTGPAEILGDDCRFGTLIRHRSIDDAVRAISHLLDDPNSSMQARRSSTERGNDYSAESVAEKWVEVLT
jgi:glycosyltransferase involved in cell wall biosynthesis